MYKINNAVTICALFLLFSFSSVFSQSTKIDSLKSLINTINEDRNKEIAEMEVRYKKAKKEADFENTVLENKLKEQQLAEANFQLISILLISIITVAFIITFYYLKSKRIIAEREAQELQVEALQKRLLELQLKHEGTKKTIDISQINLGLIPPLTKPEIETLQLSLEGLATSEIAEKLLVSINTIKIYLRNSYKKLGVKGKKEVSTSVEKSS